MKKAKGKQIAVANEIVSEAAFFSGESAVASKRITQASPYQPARSTDRFSNKTENLANFPNLQNFPTPYSIYGNYVTIQEMVELCRKAYWRFPLLRNVIDIMCEFSIGDIYLRGDNKQSNTFTEAWLDKIDIWKLQDQFYRETYRSNNTFLYRSDGEFAPEDLKRITQVYGARSIKKTVPVRYTVLDPATVAIMANVTFQMASYYKVYNGFELERLRHPKTPEDEAVRESLGTEALKDLDSGVSPYVRLDPEKLSAIFYKKQDYEPFAVPFIWGILDLIELKLAMHAMDRAVIKAADWAILHFKVGDEKTGIVNQKSLDALKAIFNNEAIRRTLTTDYTVKGEWLIPDLSKILGKEKYAQVNEDLMQGLNAVLFDAGEKFANQSVKVQVFLARTQEVRNMFLKEFLQPEIKRVCKEMGFKTYPTAYYEDYDLRDQSVYAKIYSTMYQLGILTPEQTIKAVETGILPSPADSLEGQQEFKDQKKKMLYQPVITKAADPTGAGRPTGSAAPQGTKKISPIGTGGVDISKVKTNLDSYFNLLASVEQSLKKEHKIKKLNEDQQSMAKELALAIVLNEKDWEGAVKSYIKAPKPSNKEASDMVTAIGAELGVEQEIATILWLSRAS